MVSLFNCCGFIAELTVILNKQPVIQYSTQINCMKSIKYSPIVFCKSAPSKQLNAVGKIQLKILNRKNKQKMQKMVQKSLQVTIVQQLSQLNMQNAELYALLRKLHATDHLITEPLSHKLENIKADIRAKVKQLASNVDLLYQILDRKIAVLVAKIQHAFAQPNTHAVVHRTTQLEEELQTVKAKCQNLLVQNEYLKNQNIALVEELEAKTRAKVQTLTNDSRNNQLRTEPASDPESSLQAYGSPLVPASSPKGNDLTFQRSPAKKIRSQQNSFSSALIREQNSFQPSYGSQPKAENPVASKLGFGCMPNKSTPLPKSKPSGIKYESSHSKILNLNREVEEEQEGDKSHRMLFLINNLKDQEQESFTSSESSRMYYPRDDVSRGPPVKKYHI